MSELTSPDLKNKKTRKWFAIFGGSTLWLSILLHVLFGVGAAYLVVEHFQKKHVNFQATEPPASHTEIEHKVEMAKRNNVESAPPDLKRITTTDLSTISLPDVPDMPPTDEATTSLMAGDGVTGDGLGGGAGGGSGGGIDPFGSADGKGLEGTFYDLKQTPDKQPSGIDYNQFYVVLRGYIDSHWDDSLLEKFFKAPKPIYASRFAIAMQDSENAPKAFHVDQDVSPHLWAAHYHGKVMAPGGTYRFIGFGDNFLVVRIDGVVVLDAGLNPLTNVVGASHAIQMDWFSAYDHNGDTGRFKMGTPFHMAAGDPVDMDVLIGDDYGICGYYLMIVKVGDADAPDITDTAAIPFFQLNTSPAPQFGPDDPHPPYSTTPEPWEISDSGL